MGQHKTHQHTKMGKSKGEKKKREKYSKTNGKNFPSLMKNINIEMQESQNIHKVGKYIRIHT